MLIDLVSPGVPFGDSAKGHIISVLARMPELHYIGSEEVNAIADLGPQVVKRGEALVPQGQHGDRQLVILLAGVCAVFRTIDLGNKKADVQINTVYGPSAFGEMSMFTNSPTMAMVVPAQGVIVINVSETDLNKIFHEAQNLEKIQWGFARLGIARCKSAARRYLRIAPEIFDGTEVGSDFIYDKVRGYEAILKKGSDPSVINQEFYNNISAKLEKLDMLLALALYYKSRPPFIVPAKLTGLGIDPKSVPPVVGKVLKFSSCNGVTIKEAVAKVLDTDWHLLSDLDGLVSLFEEMVALSEQAYDICTANSSGSDDAKTSLTS